MALDRDAILEALRERLEESVPDMRQVSRRIRGFDQANYPALFISTDSMIRDNLGKWTIDVRVNALLNVPPNSENPEALLNAVVNAIDAALDVRPDEMPTFGNGPTTLGGKCAECGISTTKPIEVDQGIDGIGEAVIPIEIIAYES